MATPPQFLGQRRFEELLEQIRVEQKEKQDKLLKEFEDLREERKISLNVWSVGMLTIAKTASAIELASRSQRVPTKVTTVERVQ